MPNNDMMYVKVKVQHTSYETMNEQGWEPSENHTSEGYGSSITKKLYRRFLTNRQQLILKLVLEGKTRREIADILSISEQAIHQIIPRMRKRLNAKAGISLDGWKRRHGGY